MKNNLKQELRDKLLSHLSDHNTEANVNIAFDVCRDFSVLFSLFCAENYIHLAGNKWMHYWEGGDEEYTTEDLFNKFLEGHGR